MYSKTSLSICVLIVLINSTCFAQSTIVWSIKHPSINHTSYLVGTFHQLGNSFVDSLPIIKQILIQSDIAVFESIDTKDKVVKLLNNRSDEFEYKVTFKKSDVLFLETYSQNWAVPICKLKPIELLIKLQQEYIKTNCGTVKPSDTWDHFDNYLIYIAKEKNIPIIGLETDSLQTIDINMNSPDFNWKQAKKPIIKLISQIESSKRNSIQCKQALDYMSFTLNYQFDQKCGDESLILRNESWMPIILSHIATKNTFIAVGLLHLYGECGLIEKLRATGNIIEPMPMKK